MAQPDNYGFSEEASLLKDSARKFFKNNFSTDKLHRMVADNPDSSKRLAASGIKSSGSSF